MPRYGFLCNQCQQPFSQELSREEYEEGSVVCPYCESEDVERREIA
jgi:putative FmdB family regulatory protein